MGLIVKKFGGTSLGDVSRLKNVAVRIRDAHESGQFLAIVVSARGNHTDTLIDEYKKTSPHVGPEFDVVVSAGEQISAGLLAQELQNLGVEARSWLGWQIPILTCGSYGAAQIEHIEAKKLQAEIKSGVIPIVTGFQGVDKTGRITTLGRGGSDFTAVALAVALGADKCDIYTDVPGVYAADPKKQSGTKKLNVISYEEMLAFVDQGAKVIERRAVELAQKNSLKIEVLSSFENVSGTIIGDVL